MREEWRFIKRRPTSVWLWLAATSGLPACAWAQAPETAFGGASYLWLALIALLVLQSLLIVGLQRRRTTAKHAHQKLRETQRELERRIEERTESWDRANHQLQDEVRQHQATERLLRDTRDYLHSIINAIPSVLIGVTPDGRVTHWNTATELATGVGSDEALGEPLHQVYPSLPISMSQITQTIESGTPCVNENVQKGAGSSARYTDLCIYPLIAAQTIGAVIRMDDITARVRVENMMIQNERMTSLGELAAGMAHEINNPLSTILHGVQNIQRRTSGELEQNRNVANELDLRLEHVHEYLARRGVDRILEDIRGAGERSLQIVSNMLEFSRGNDRSCDQFDLVRIIQHSLELNDNTPNLKGPEGHQRPRLVTDFADNIPPVMGSAAEVQQVLLNLLRNAVQAFHGAAATNGPAIHVSAYADLGSAVIEIEDNGPGMRKEVCRHIFEPFFTTKEVGEGTGLGLSVSYFIITEHHSGTINVESSPGEGTRFIIRLPLALPAEPQNSAISAHPESPS